MAPTPARNTSKHTTLGAQQSPNLYLFKHQPQYPHFLPNSSHLSGSVPLERLPGHAFAKTFPTSRPYRPAFHPRLSHQSHKPASVVSTRRHGGSRAIRDQFGITIASFLWNLDNPLNLGIPCQQLPYRGKITRFWITGSTSFCLTASLSVNVCRTVSQIAIPVNERIALIWRRFVDLWFTRKSCKLGSIIGLKGFGVCSRDGETWYIVEISTFFLHWWLR